MMYMLRRAFVVLACCVALCIGDQWKTAPNLDQIVKDFNLKVDDQTITTGGLSSGAYFAVQFHVAFSSFVKGVAVFAGGPYMCAMGNLMVATSTCMAPLTPYQAPKASEYKALAETAAAKGNIDPLTNLADDPVFVFSGALDSVISQTVVKSAAEFYGYFMPTANIQTEYTINAEHTQPTLNFGNECRKLGSPYISKCSYDGAGIALKHLYGSLTSSVSMVSSNLMQFDQTSYFSGSKTSLNNVGYIYIPTSCRNGATCKLHVNFHGCEQGIQQIGDEFAHDSGYNEWAEANNIIVLYPYAKADSLVGNPNGCWDWWAYTNKEYAYKTGVQMEFARKLVAALV